MHNSENSKGVGSVRPVGFVAEATGAFQNGIECVGGSTPGYFS
jgi:hypothetical protein